MVLSSALLGETRPTASQRAPRPARSCGWRHGGVASRAADGEITAVRAKPAAARCASLYAGVGHGQRRARRQQAQVPLGPQLPEGQVVVPGRHQLGRRDVVVVHHERLGPAGQPRRHGRGGGELVHDDVARLAPSRGRRGQALSPSARLLVDGVDEDLRPVPAGPGGVAQPQGVPAHGVASVQDGDEVVDAAHEGATAGQGDAPVPARPVGQRRHLDEPGPLQQQLPRRLVEGAAVDEIPGGAHRVRRPRRGFGDDDERRAALQHPPALGQQREQCVQRQAVDHAAQHDAAGRAVGAGRQMLRRLGDGHRAALLNGAQRHRTARLDAVRLARHVRAARAAGRPRRSRHGRSTPPGVRAET